MRPTGMLPLTIWHDDEQLTEKADTKTMRTPYVPHLFGADAERKLTERRGWLTSGVASSIPWPQQDVWVHYDGNEYILRGATGGDHQRSPCISTPCAHNEVDSAMTRMYRFASILGWFKHGYVELTGSGWGTAPIRYSSRDTAALTLDGNRYFSCNYMPIIDDDQVRKALAFMREGKRLRHVHQPYAFLSFFKVVESQFTSKDRVAWIQANLDQLDGEAASRVAALRATDVDVSKHLYESGRCAIAHASLGESIVDPDVPADRRRIAEDLVVMEALAMRYLKVEVRVPDEMELYKSRDRTAPWHTLLPENTLRRLRNGEHVRDSAEFGQLQNRQVSVRLWPHEPAESLSGLTMVPEGLLRPGVVQFLAYNERKTLFLRFALDLARGRLHTMIENGGLTEEYNELTETDVEHFTRYFHSVVGNALVELCLDGVDPVPCEVVIPRNVIPRAPEEAVAEALEKHRLHRAKRVAAHRLDGNEG